VSVSANTTYRPPFSYATFDQIRQHSRSFAGSLAFSNRGKGTLTLGGESQTVDRFFVSGDFFDTLGVSPLLGRLLRPADDGPSGGTNGRVAVIGYKLWQERFGGAVSVIGTSVTLARTAVTIVGVTPPEFFGVEVGSAFDMILPIKANLPGSAFDDDVPWLSIMLRLKPGMSLTSATAALRAVQPQVRVGALPKRFQSVFLSEPFTLEPAGAGTSTLRDRFERPLVAILVAPAVTATQHCRSR
jgi:putative ABC transport system permease protein